MTDGAAESRSYYGRPILKEPVWKPTIPFYLFFGGLAGASSVLHGLARVAGNDRLAKASLYVGARCPVRKVRAEAQSLNRSPVSRIDSRHGV